MLTPCTCSVVTLVIPWFPHFSTQAFVMKGQKEPCWGWGYKAMAMHFDSFIFRLCLHKTIVHEGTKDTGTISIAKHFESIYSFVSSHNHSLWRHEGDTLGRGLLISFFTKRPDMGGGVGWAGTDGRSNVHAFWFSHVFVISILHEGTNKIWGGWREEQLAMHFNIYNHFILGSMSSSNLSSCRGGVVDVEGNYCLY